MPTPDDLVASAREFLGTPFAHMGRNAHGVDCIGLVILSVENAGMGRYDTPGYDRQPSRYLLTDGIAEHLVRVGISDIKRGDLLVFRFGRYPQHVGIYSGATVIHCYEQVGRVIEHRMDNTWNKRLFSAFRFKEFV
jgi:cell wall-associated NlpC family hydrolase